MKNSFIKDASILTIGTTVAQFLPMLLYPVLGRLYSPEQFAALAAFTSIITVLQVIGSGKYETAILIADDDREAANIWSLSIALSVVLMIVLYGILVIFGTDFTYSFSSGLGDLIWLAPIGCVLLNIFTCYNEWCVRRQYFKKLSLNKITNSVTITLGKFFSFYTPLQSIGLTFGDFFGRLLTALVCLARLFIHDSQSFSRVSVPGMKALAKKYKNFPLYTMPAQLLNAIAAAAPVFILSYFYSDEKVGFFSMTMSVLLLPINVISYAVRDVFRKKANDIYKESGHFEDLYKRVFFLFSIATIIACVVIGPFLPQLFSFVLGERWGEAGVYSRILLPMIGFDFVAMALSGVFIVVQKLKSLFVWQCFYCAATIGSLMAGSYLHLPIEETLEIFNIARIGVYAYMIIIMYLFSKGVNKQ